MPSATCEVTPLCQHYCLGEGGKCRKLYTMPVFFSSCPNFDFLVFQEVPIPLCNVHEHFPCFVSSCVTISVTISAPHSSPRDVRRCTLRPTTSRTAYNTHTHNQRGELTSSVQSIMAWQHRKWVQYIIYVLKIGYSGQLSRSAQSLTALAHNYIHT